MKDYGLLILHTLSALSGNDIKRNSFKIKFASKKIGQITLVAKMQSVRAIA